MIGISGRHWACWNRLDLLYMIRGLKYVECAQKLNKNSLFLMKIQSKYAVFAVLKAVLRAYGVRIFILDSCRLDLKDSRGGLKYAVCAKTVNRGCFFW